MEYVDDKDNNLPAAASTKSAAIQGHSSYEHEDDEAGESQALLDQVQPQSKDSDRASSEYIATGYPPSLESQRERGDEDEGWRRRRRIDAPKGELLQVGIRSDLLTEWAAANLTSPGPQIESQQHPWFPFARTIFFSVLGVLSMGLILLAFRSLFHTATSHAPGSPFSSSHPPSDPSLLAKSLLPSKELSNGTHPWRKTIILVSLDGLKPSYLTREKMPNLYKLGIGSASGSQSKTGSLLAESMTPIFPTLTFPNHWSILTGLNSESHGIIGNNFYLQEDFSEDASLSGESFFYTDPTRSWDPRWWKGQPVWATAERAGVPTAVLMWPGPPRTSDSDRPALFQEYQSGWTLKDRNERISNWLDLEIGRRPQLICAYVPDVDQIGHKLGPDAVDSTLSRVDLFISSLSDLIQSRNLSQIVDFVVVSDHGMTATSNSRLIYLDKVLGLELFSQIQAQDAWPNVGLHFKGDPETRQKRLEAAEKILRKASKSHGGGRAFKVYRKQEIPESWGWKASPRLAELLLIPEFGWSFTSEEEMRIHSIDGIYQPLGNHGYSPSSPEMAAIFVASGPSFKTTKSINGIYNIGSFRNLEIYNLVCDLIGLPKKARSENNGTDGFWDEYLYSG